MPMDHGGPNGCLWRWMTGKAPGTDLFICSHGGWDKKSTFTMPAGASMCFWGPKGKSITADECWAIMEGNPKADVKARTGQSAIGGGALVWDYTISEFDYDWQGAMGATQDALNEKKLQHDCVMIRDEHAKGGKVKVSHVVAAFPGYKFYHLMACRVE